jgi:hypothetical protein
MGEVKCHGGTQVERVAALYQPVPNTTTLLWEVAFCVVSIVSMNNTHYVARVGLVSVIRNTESVGLFSVGTESISKCHIQNLGGRCWQHISQSVLLLWSPCRHSATEYSSFAEVNSQVVPTCCGT